MPIMTDYQTPSPQAAQGHPATEPEPGLQRLLGNFTEDGLLEKSGEPFLNTFHKPGTG